MKSFLKRFCLLLLAVCLFMGLATPKASAAINLNVAKYVIENYTISNRTPIKRIKKGSCWTCNGKITSRYSTIKSIRAEISDGKQCFSSAEVPVNAKTYNLSDYGKAKSIDKNMRFDKLNIGTYYYRVFAKDARSNTYYLLFADTFTVYK